MNEVTLAAPISPLRQRLIDDMAMRRFSHETQRNYIRDVERFATFLGRSPDTAMAEDLRRFQVEQREAGVPVPTMNSIVAALRFFFTHTLDRSLQLRPSAMLHSGRKPTGSYRRARERSCHCGWLTPEKKAQLVCVSPVSRPTRTRQK